ncbi:MAG: hypothetical protein MI867_08515 [Pseudomonadales bacterium]|nr:hypothetical protein [Pseudomonadales bacterium]
MPLTTVNHQQQWCSNVIYGLLYLLCLLAANTSSADTTSPKSISWIKWDQRPIFYTDPSSQKVEGIYQNIIDYLHSNAPLNEYQQKELMVNHSRFNRIAQSPDNCYLGWVTYNDLRIESRPITMIKPWAIWTLADKQEVFGEPDNILSLERLILDPNVKVGVIKHFTYSQSVLDILIKHKGNPSLIVANTSAIEINPRTLIAGRMDVFLGNPGQMQRKRKEAHTKSQFIKYGIKEANEHRTMLVSCADDKKGRQVISAINQFIEKDPQSFYEQILKFHHEWLGEITSSFLEQFKAQVFPIKSSSQFLNHRQQ